MNAVKEKLEDWKYKLMPLPEDASTWVRVVKYMLLILVLVNLILMFIWSSEPDSFDIRARAEQRALEQGVEIVTGYMTAVSLEQVAKTMLDKRGGYLTNDRLSPAILLDNIPNWEYGVVTQLRDLAQALRNDMSRSQTQSTEDSDLVITHPQLNFDNDSWLLPATETEYNNGLKALDSYMSRLANPGEPQAQFYARADNLREWLALIEKRLGSLSQRLSASVGQVRVNTDLGGDAEAVQATSKPRQVVVSTPWWEIDDVFYEARGSCWALIHFMKAIEVDFTNVLEKKNAVVSLRQIIRELESTQDTVWSPIIMNGTGFGLTANHSLVMASYISRANAAVIDLRNLLEQG